MNREWCNRCCALALILTFGLPAVQASEDEGLAELLDLLAEETELATRSKQNADYVPGIISVLHGDEARLLGARSVLDAIAQIPGMEINRDQFGSATIRVRSIDFFFNGGNVKVLVDSLPISRETAFQNSAVLLMPIEQVERIEVIRGPGSGVHGDFAFMGLVNIVTRSDGNALTGSVGSGQRRSGVWQFDTASDEAPVELHGSLSHWQSERYDAPDSLNNDESRQHLSVALNAGAFSLRAAAVQRDYSGLATVSSRPGAPPPPSPTESVLQDETNQVVQARYLWERDPEHRGAAWLQYNRSDFDRGIAGFDGSRLELGGESVWRIGRHLLLTQLQLADLRIHDAFVPPDRMLPPINESRDYLAFNLQDQVDIGERIQLTGGLRYDRLQGIDDAWTPRLAAHWKIAERHLLKAQYAEGFRSPTYQEIYEGGPVPERTPFERVRTLEVAYVYRTADTVLRATAFDAKVTDMIFPRSTPAFGTGREIESRGWEFELTHRWSERYKSIATWSTANADDGRAAVIVPGQPTTFGGPSVGQPESLGNLSLLAKFTPQWSAGLHWNHVGRRATRGQEGLIPGYQSVNLGVEFTPERVPGLRLGMAWRNLLDEPIMHFATQPPSSVRQLRFDEPQWSFSVHWEFD